MSGPHIAISLLPTPTNSHLGALPGRMRLVPVTFPPPLLLTAGALPAVSFGTLRTRAEQRMWQWITVRASLAAISASGDNSGDFLRMPPAISRCDPSVRALFPSLESMT